MRCLGLDIGERKIGVALGDPRGILASPRTIIDYREAGKAITAILHIIAENQVGKVVAGLPRSLDGREGPQAQKVKAFVEELQKQVAVPIIFRDERFSSRAARRLLREAGRSGKTRDDAAAAALILQSYLDEAADAAA